MRKAANTAVLMAILIFGEKILGFIREVLMAGFFGTNYVVDSYVMASNIPGILFAGIFTSVGVAFLPIYSELNEREGADRANRFASETIVLTTVIASSFAILGIILAGPIVSLLPDKFSAGPSGELTVMFLRITFGYIIFVSFAAVLESFLQYRGVFLKPVLAGYLQNFSILGAILLAALVDYRLLPLGLLIGAMLRSAAIIKAARTADFKFTPTLRIGSTARQIVALALPVFIGGTINQINSLVDKFLASSLGEGAVAGLNYGFLLINMVTGLTIMVVVTIIYPRLTQSAAQRDFQRFNNSVGRGMNIAALITVPCTLGILLYSSEAIRLVFERGAFTAASTELTSQAFFYYAFGLVFIAINALVAKAFYALKDTRTPVICGITSAVLNIVLNLLLIGPMQIRGPALATSIAAAVNAFMLVYLLKKRHPHIRILESRGDFCRIILAGFLAVGMSWPAYYLLAGRWEAPALISLPVTVVVAVFIYLLLLKALRIPELAMLKDIVPLPGRKSA